MKIYLYIPEPKSETLRATKEHVEQVVRRLDAEVFTQHSDVSTLIAQQNKRSAASTSFLDSMDAVIIEGTEPDADVGYLLALAIAHRRPTLLLLHKGRVRHNPIETFEKHHRLPATLKTAYYQPASLPAIILQFVERLADIRMREVPTIKFTLRVTPTIERFLAWKAKRTSQTKAEFVRELLERLLKEDRAFRSPQRNDNDRADPPKDERSAQP